MKGVLLPAVTSPCVFTGDHGSVCVHPTLHIVDPKIKKPAEVMDVCTHFIDPPVSF